MRGFTFGVLGAVALISTCALASSTLPHDSHYSSSDKSDMIASSGLLNDAIVLRDNRYRMEKDDEMFYDETLDKAAEWVLYIVCAFLCGPVCCLYFFCYKPR